MTDLIWLASYPKSGNTWFRIFLTNLRRGTGTPADINDLDRTSIASARTIFDDATGIEASDLTFDEIDRLRSQVHELMAEEAEEPEFHKIHDAFTVTSDGIPIVPRAKWSRAIYLIRNPLDVAVSFSNHNSSGIEKTILQMAKPHSALAKNIHRCDAQLQQKLLSWSEHVMSWVDESGIDLHMIRYEDMKLNPLETFAGAVNFAGLDHNEAQVLNALKRSHFNELKKQEERFGFREKPPGCKSFFHRGKVGSWRDVLTTTQAERIIDAHRDVMSRFGYVSEIGEPTF